MSIFEGGECGSVPGATYSLTRTGSAACGRRSSSPSTQRTRCLRRTRRSTGPAHRPSMAPGCDRAAVECHACWHMPPHEGCMALHDVADGTADGSNWAPASLNVAAMTVVSRGHTTHSIMVVDAVTRRLASRCQLSRCGCDTDAVSVRQSGCHAVSCPPSTGCLLVTHDMMTLEHKRASVVGSARPPVVWVRLLCSYAREHQRGPCNLAICMGQLESRPCMCGPVHA